MTIGRIPSVEGGIQPTIVDAKGDLIAGVAADSVNRLAVGSNDQVLVADSAASTGMAWKSYGFQAENPVLNSGMDIWQRGTSFASGARQYGPDRFPFLRGSFAAGATLSRQTTSDTTNLPNIQYCARMQRDSGNTSTAAIVMYQEFETVNSIPFAGKTVTISFYARRGANYSASGNGLYLELTSGTGTDQTISGGYTGGVNVASTTAALTTTWQRFTATGTIPANATEIGFYVMFTPTGTAGANDYYEATGFQIDVGSVATPYKRAMNTLQGELAACQRYYWQAIDGSVTNQTLMNANAFSTTDCRGVIQFPVTMRTEPTLVQTSSTNYWNFQAASADGFDSLVMTQASKNNCLLYAGSGQGVNGLTAGQGGTIYIGNSAARLAFSAEL